MDAGSVDAQRSAGLSPTYATLWIGDWNLKQGWKQPDRVLAELRERNVTPVVHFYYWAEDLSASCLEEGCNGKSRADWVRLEQQLVVHLDKGLGGHPVIVVLETEFNKAKVARSSAFDGYLADMVDRLHADYDGATVVLALGNWNPAAWGTWQRSAAASDWLGLQALSASTQDGRGKADLFNKTLDGVAKLRDLYGKPVMLVDVAVSSFPEPDRLGIQAQTMQAFLGGQDQLRDAGVVAVLYRSFLDTPSMALANHFGEAERHWGLAWPDGTLKPAGEAWLRAMGVPVPRSTAPGVELLVQVPLPKP